MQIALVMGVGHGHSNPRYGLQQSTQRHATASCLFSRSQILEVGLEVMSFDALHGKVAASIGKLSEIEYGDHPRMT